MTQSKLDITVNSDDIESIAYFKDLIEDLLKNSYWRDSFQVGNILINEQTKNFGFSAILSMTKIEIPSNRKTIKLTEVK